jgi:ABC-type Mn2+/Zn2+ transport system permease subunit
VFLASCFLFEVEIFELFQGDEGLLHFQWLDRNLNAVEDVFIIMFLSLGFCFSLPTLVFISFSVVCFVNILFGENLIAFS